MSAEAIGVAVAAFVIALLKSLHNGRLRGLVNKKRASKRTADDAHSAIPEVLDAVERLDQRSEQTYEKVVETNLQVQAIGETVFLLHRDDEIHEGVLRDRLGVEDLPNDIFPRGDNPTRGPEPEQEQEGRSD